MVWSAWWAGRREVGRVYGPDLMLAVLARAVDRGWSSFFYGGGPGTAELLAGRLTTRFPGLRVAGTLTPPFRPLTPEEDADTVQAINDSGAQLVWVGLSTPKQERWMAEHVGRLRANVLFGVGAAFDIHAGTMSPGATLDAAQRAGMDLPAQPGTAAAVASLPAKQPGLRAEGPGPSTATGPGDARIVCRDRDPTRGREQRDEHDSSTTGRPSRGITSNWRRIMRIRRAVVTGGAGFLGSHLCQRLLQDGYEVICLDDFCTGSSTNVEHLLEDRRFRLVRADVTDFIHVSGHVDAVLHLASPASPIDYLQLPLHTLKVGSIGTLHSLGLAKDKKARFLLASTSESYGDPLVHPQPETYWGNVNPVGPRGVYDEAKRFAEAATMAYRRARAVDTAIARIFNTFGPRMRPWDGRAIPTFIGQALRGEPLTVAGDGSQTRSVCYVDDLIEGLMRLLHSDLEGPVNIGNCGEMSVLELAHLIIELTDSSSEIVFVDRPAGRSHRPPPRHHAGTHCPRVGAHGGRP